MQIFHVISLLLAVSGVMLNNRKHRSSFLCWIFSNIIWGVVNWTHGLQVEALQNAIFLYLALDGLYRWRDVKW
jgi:nicotinamide riboside transporter PnuC